MLKRGYSRNEKDLGYPPAVLPDRIMAEVTLRSCDPTRMLVGSHILRVKAVIYSIGNTLNSQTVCIGPNYILDKSGTTLCTAR